MKNLFSKGHAGYAEEGQDIVCAAVSALIITTVNSLEKFTDDKFDVQEKDGFVSIHFTEMIFLNGGALLWIPCSRTDGNCWNSYNNRYLTVKVKEV